MIHTTQKMSTEVNRKCRPRNTMVQLSTPATLILYATMHSITDRRTDRLTDDSMTPIADHTV